MDYVRRSKLSRRSAAEHLLIAQMSRQLVEIEEERLARAASKTRAPLVTAVLALPSLLVAIVALWFAVDFNNWQRSSTERSRTEDNAHMAASMRELLIDRCYRLATDGTNLAKGLGTRAAEKIIDDYSRREPRCLEVGVDIPQHMARLVIDEQAEYPDAIVSRSKKLRASRGTSPPSPTAPIENADGIRSFNLAGVGPRIIRSAHPSDADIGVLRGDDRSSGFYDLERFLLRSTDELSPRPRVMIDTGVSWASAFGPPRLDIVHDPSSDKTTSRKLLPRGPRTYF